MDLSTTGGKQKLIATIVLNALLLTLPITQSKQQVWEVCQEEQDFKAEEEKKSC